MVLQLPSIKTGQGVMGKTSKHQHPSSRETSSTKLESASRRSLPEDAREDQVQFFRFAVELTRFRREAWFGGCDHPQEVFGLLGFFDAAADRVAKILLRNTFVSLAIVRTHTRSGADELTDQPVVAGIARNCFREVNNRFSKNSCALFQ